MIQKLKHIVLCSSLLTVVGCADWFASEDIFEPIPDTSGTIVSLRIQCPGDDHHASRAPQGGQYGDGFEEANQWSEKLKGVNYDYKIQDLCLFIVDTNGISVENYLNTCADDAPFFGAYYADNLELETTDDANDDHEDHPIDMRYVAKVNVGPLLIEPFFHRIIVVANVGNIIEDTNNPCNTVGKLRNLVAAKGYTRAEGNDGNIYINCEDDGRITASANAPSHFAMGLYEEPSMIQKRKGTYEDPHIASVTLERLSARVDFILTAFPSERSQKADPFAPIPYDVKASKDGPALSRNWITHVRLVNAAEKPSYLLRRTASDATGSGMRILGFEKADANNITTNYVLDLYTANKTAIPNDYFGTTRLNDTYERDFNDGERVISRGAFKSTETGYSSAPSAFAYDDQSTSENYFIIGYPQENTLRPEDMNRQYTTGILYRSIYEPATFYRLDNSGTKLKEPDTVTSLTTDVLSDGSTPAGGIKSAHYGKTFWMMERLVPNPTEADRVYFVADDPGDQNGDGITTDAGKTKIMKAAQLYMADHNETGWTQPLEYVGGVAYNYYWIRHSNSQGTGHPFSPMEYSIVRNNIYSVSITSFSGPGAPSTDYSMDNPDRIQPITYVHKWHPYTVEEVGM